MSIFLEILVNLPLPQSFTYKNLDSHDKKYKEAKIGMRCEVHFGSRKLIGCIIGISNTIPSTCSVSEEKIKSIGMNAFPSKFNIAQTPTAPTQTTINPIFLSNPVPQAK